MARSLLKESYMIKTILPLFTLFLSSNAFAQETWQGYLPIEKVSAPHKELAMSSVVQIRTAGLLPKDKDKYEVVEVSKTKIVTKKSVLDYNLRAFQIETCRGQGLKKCPVFKTSDVGTGLINNGHDLYTCRHVMHNWITIAADLNSLDIQQISPPMLILDYKKNVLYNSAYKDQDLINIDSINTDRRLNIFIKPQADYSNKVEILYALSEFVVLKSSIDLIAPVVAPTSHNFSINEQVYFTGYPGATTAFGKNSKLNTPGDILVSSTGTIYEISDSKKLFSSHAFTNPGMSGGIVTNSKGEVIGLICTADYEKGMNPSDVSTGSIFFDLNAQKQLWTDLLSLSITD
jgi:hypothetical protein